MNTFAKLALSGILLFSLSLNAMGDKPKDESATEKVEDTYDAAKNKTKEAYREVKDEACELVNGKMECAGQKMKHKAKNMKDDVEDEVKDLKR